jgi:DNA-binding response OmpR family regulator
MSDWLLVVDDDDEVRQAYQGYFVCAGFEVRCAASLAEATDRLGATRFDAVIADVSLTPEGSEGLAIAAYVQALRRSSPARSAPVVVLTAYGSPSHAGAAASLGVDVSLHKPPSLLWLENEIRARIGEGRRACLPEGERRPGADLGEPWLRLLAEGLTRGPGPSGLDASSSATADDASGGCRAVHGGNHDEARSAEEGVAEGIPEHAPLGNRRPLRDG